MRKSDIYKPIKVQENVLKIVDECFMDERNGNLDARKLAFEKLEEYLIKTDDGSYTLKSEGLNGETMHTYHGGVDESREKYVKPAKLAEKDSVRVLDICSGLGYTAAVCIEYLNNELTSSGEKPDITIDMVEISELTLATGLILPSPISSHQIVKKAIEDQLFSTGFLNHRQIKCSIPDNIHLNVHITDAREFVGNKNSETDNRNINIKLSSSLNPSINDNSNEYYDAVFLAPFSPSKSPELFSLELLGGIKYLLKPDGMFLTYTAASAVRSALVILGFYIGEGPSFGRSGGTLASLTADNIEKSLSKKDERMVALTDAGVPLKDPDLNDSSDEIVERRKAERAVARAEYKFASTVKSPIYLCNDTADGRLKRRVLKDIRRLGFEDLISEKTKYLVCPQYTECICGRGCEYLEFSNERIIEMEKRLDELVKN